MENCINSNCIDEVSIPQKQYNLVIRRVTNFLNTFTIEGAEELSKTK
ncbi:hypothetical protein SAMN06265377_0423 [Flagellimonas pacifica]|uniref:Uncharacterized protein n=1 Tax=Flagellimonas pacifica TaxID=1247520 RepID=A0A285MDI9_9FLAO|nr:hypothetical protein SAMN06265377_0423 [Allomuricauda parva]